MNENRRHHVEAAADHEALASLLRDADPVAGDTGLDAVERARMRQAITTAADRHAVAGLWAGSWWGWKQPALAAAALITVAGLALWALDRTTEMPSSNLADAGATDPVAVEVEPAAPTSSEPAPVATPFTQPEDTTAAAVNDPSPPDRQARTVQFTAPGGTRIIWTLDPDFELSTAGGDARQEQEQ